MAAVTRDVDVRFAVLTDSLLVRGIVTALAWLGVPHHAFATDQHRQASNYLELNDAESAELHEALVRLRREAQV